MTQVSNISIITTVVTTIATGIIARGDMDMGTVGAISTS